MLLAGNNSFGGWMDFLSIRIRAGDAVELEMTGGKKVELRIQKVCYIRLCHAAKD